MFVIAPLATSSYPVRSDFSSGEKAAIIGFCAFVVLLYLTPTIIAVIRRCPTAGQVAVLNIFLGWTLMWWAIALALALQPRPRPATRLPPAPAAAGPWSAGWYPDPINAYRLRYYDGFRWTDAIGPRR